MGLVTLERDSCFNLGQEDMGLNEELGRHKGRNGMTGCILCGDECESVVHILECPAYKDSREKFVVKLRAILGDTFKDFEALDNVEKAFCAIGYELWTENLDSLFALVKEYIIDLWEVRKVKLYGRIMLYPTTVSVLS